MRLTDLTIKGLQRPAKGQITYIDDTVPGFGVRVSQGGVKSFVLVQGRSRRRITLGRYPTISLQDARARAKELLAERVLGKRDLHPICFEEALALFLSTYFAVDYPKPSYKAEVERQLKKHFLPSLRYEKLEIIQPHFISCIIDRMHATPGEARHAFATIRLFFNWATRRGYVERSPCEHLRAPSKTVARDRVLTSEELKLILVHVQSEDTTYHSILQLLLYTGQRRGEIAALEAEWVDFENRTITLPSGITKNKRKHTFPFGSLSEAILRSALRKREAEVAVLEMRPKRLGCLFPARGKETPFAGWSKSKPDFDKDCPLEHWTLHDLRRTCATMLAALGVPVHVTEKLLNHISGTTGGIVAVYQRHAYFDEMQSAIARWEEYLAVLMAFASISSFGRYKPTSEMRIAA